MTPVVDLQAGKLLLEEGQSDAAIGSAVNQVDQCNDAVVIGCES